MGGRLAVQVRKEVVTVQGGIGEDFLRGCERGSSLVSEQLVMASGLPIPEKRGNGTDYMRVRAQRRDETARQCT